MNTSRYSLVASLLVTAICSAQTQPTYRLDAQNEQMTLVSSTQKPGLHVLVVAQNGATVPTPIGGLLAQGNAVAFAETRDGAATFTIPVSAELAAQVGANAQVVALNDGSAVAGPVFAARSVFDTSQPFDVSKAQKEPLRDVEVHVGKSSSKGVLFRYVAASSDHALHVAAIVRHGSLNDVYLVLKTPGPGEGLKDVVETHELRLDLGAGARPALRVFATHGPDEFGAPLMTYRPLALRHFGR